MTEVDAIDGMAAALVVPFLAFTRAAFIVVLLPLLGTKKTPAMVRVGLILIITVVLLREAPTELSADNLATLFFAEAITGATIGVLARLLWELMLLPLALMDISLGRGSMGGPPITGDQSEGALTTLGGLAFLALYASVAGHLTALRGLSAAIPWGRTNVDAGQFLESFSSIFELAVSIACPALLVALLVDLTLGWANRTLPSLPAMFVAMPLRSLIGWILVPPVILAGFWGLEDVGADWFFSVLGF